MIRKRNVSDKVVTEKMLNSALTDFADSILAGMDNMFNGLRDDMKSFQTQNSIEHMEIRQDLADLKRNTPTMTQHESLKKDFELHVKHHHLASYK